ncbi:MAG: class I SAM-dependent methyltransferase [Candidatus Aureabacteria bacterium]|nr:class I SAM-dependent methyltransferase [Candidatus Auribacterota bacterium]
MQQEDLKEKEKYESVWKHDEYRHFSPGERAIDKFGLIDLLRKSQVKTILDAGCGSGKLMQKILEECGSEFTVHGFDIADNCLDPYFNNIKDDILTLGVLWNPDDFNKKYDAIICTDVLEHIPTNKISQVLNNLFRCTNTFCYLAIALFQDGFGPEILGESLHLTVKEPAWWLEQIKNAGFKEIHPLTEKHTSGADVWLHVFLLKTRE